VNRSSAFFINGGAGRVICSIPAFELYANENPEDDFIIVCEGGMDFFKGHPALHKRAFDVWHKGLFESYLKDRNCISPEPYRVWEYYNQKCNLTQAFDICLSNKGIRELSSPKIYHNKQEIVEAHNLLQEIKQTTGLEKTVIIQPFGRSVQNTPDFVVDPSSRSLTLNDTIEIVNAIKNEYTVILMSEFPVSFSQEGDDKKVATPQIPNIRIWSALFEMADHFLGCDSLGQHIAKAVGLESTIVCGSTFPVNISYPDDPNFDIIDLGKDTRVYSPIRLTAEEEQDRLNDEIMEMGEEQRNIIIEKIRKKLGSSQKAEIASNTPTPTKILNRSGE